MDHTDLATLEDLKRLKYRYLRTLDTKKWDEFADCLTADVIGSYGAKLRFSDRDSLVDYMRTSLPDSIVTVHQCHHPEIEIDGERATGRWYLQDTVLILEHRLMLTGVCFYEDEYRREADGQWRICKTGYVRQYEAMHSLDDTPSWRLTAGMGASE